MIDHWVILVPIKRKRSWSQATVRIHTDYIEATLMCQYGIYPFVQEIPVTDSAMS
jgi:hypothetical protein